MDINTLQGLLLAKIANVSSKVTSALSGILSITNVDNKLHYEFTDGTNADFEVEGEVNLTFSIDYATGHLQVAGGGN